MTQDLLAGLSVNLKHERARVKRFEAERDQLHRELWATQRQAAAGAEPWGSACMEVERNRWIMTQGSPPAVAATSATSPRHFVRSGLDSGARSSSIARHDEWKRWENSVVDELDLPPSFREHAASRRQLTTETGRMARGFTPRRGAASSAVAQVHEEAARTRAAERALQETRAKLDQHELMWCVSRVSAPRACLATGRSSCTLR